MKVPSSVIRTETSVGCREQQRYKITRNAGVGLDAVDLVHTGAKVLVERSEVADEGEHCCTRSQSLHCYPVHTFIFAALKLADI